MRRFLLVFLSIFLSFAAYSQCIERNRAFVVGEKLKYYAYYNLGMLWVKGGVATFSVSLDGDAYKLEVEAESMSEWRWVYDLKTSHVAYLDTATLKAVEYSSSTDENGLHKEETVFYSDSIFKIRTKKGDEPETERIVPYPSCSWDIICAVYIARNIDLSKYASDEPIPFDIIFDDKVYRLYGNVLGKEIIKTRSGKKYECYKCSTNVMGGTIFSADKPVYVWVTADERQMPVLVDSKISVGSVKVYLADE